MFLQRALDLPVMPIADATTENGSRYWMTGIDGDGFVSCGEFPGSPFTAELLLDGMFKRYRVPTTVLVIEGEIGADGFYPALVGRVEPVARDSSSAVGRDRHAYVQPPFEWLAPTSGARHDSSRQGAVTTENEELCVSIHAIGK